MAVYVQAQQNLDWLKSDCHQRWSLVDKQINSKDRELIDEVLRDVSTAGIATHVATRRYAKSDQKARLKNEFAWFIERVLLASFTSFSFVFSILDMKLAGWDTTNKRLTVTATSIMIFCFLVALVISERKDALGITAAYAAVLVVFVGLIEQS
ncbi:hypothetical protein V8F33_013676 [Rhypophila sp. PSN 637]